MAAEMHLRPKKVRLVAVAILLPAEMHMRTEEVLLAASEMLVPAKMQIRLMVADETLMLF
jgi:hypothetical protein